VGEKWLFSFTSRSFGYGYETVRIRVKISSIDAHLMGKRNFAGKKLV
jgi:hypothetical protein